MVGGELLLLVAHTVEFDDDEGEIIRIISNDEHIDFGHAAADGEAENEGELDGGRESRMQWSSNYAGVARMSTTQL